MPPFDEKIREVAPVWGWDHSNWYKDKIDMEYKFAYEVQKDLAVVRFETFGSIHENLAKGFARAAELIARGKVAE
jgi:hypothetical protein